MFFFDGNILHLGHIKEINYVESDCIIVSFDNYNLVISGLNLLIIQLNDDEMYIQGQIKKLDIKNDSK